MYKFRIPFFYYREMYFTDKGNSPDGYKLEKASLTGENREVILSYQKQDNIGIPEGLTMDYQTDTIYWVDKALYGVKSYNFRTRELKEVITGLQRDIEWPGIAVHEVYILFCNTVFELICFL